MTAWSLSQLLEDLHGEIEHKLEIARKSFGHNVAKGDASEGVWLEMLQTYLPKRYQAEKAFVVDSEGKFSEQIDIVIFDIIFQFINYGKINITSTLYWAILSFLFYYM